jgi:decaprenyl-phosphate phosphoribosyltransferase
MSERLSAPSSPPAPPISELEPAPDSRSDSPVSDGDRPNSVAPQELMDVLVPEGSMQWRLFGIIKTMRPHQWVKNVFVLAPIVFAREIRDPALLIRAVGAFFVFCLLAGAVYTINDLADREADALHPVKRFRPIARGQVSVTWARVLWVVLLLVALGGAAAGSLPFLLSAAAYFALNVAYSSKLKHVAYVDVGCIAGGFVLRVMAGGYAAYVHVSAYLLVCTALLALFLGFGKRRHELTSVKRKRRQRAALESYSRRVLDVMLAVTAAATFGVYLAYTLDSKTIALFHNPHLWVSSVLVALGMWRFLHLVRHRPEAESPTQVMLSDGPFVAILLGWVGMVMWVVYMLRPAV